jgi:hypothetical protein
MEIAVIGNSAVLSAQPTVAYAHKAAKAAFRTVWILNLHIAALEQVISAELA